ncbi:MAG: exodeoxyribonuclease VII small subunit [Phycisphaerae bacterium]
MARSDPQTELTFEQALAKLEAIVQSIEQGKIGLQESIQQYEEGMKLIRKCRSILTEAEQKIQKLQLAAGGELTAEPFGPGADAADETTDSQ